MAGFITNENSSGSFDLKKNTLNTLLVSVFWNILENIWLDLKIFKSILTFRQKYTARPLKNGIVVKRGNTVGEVQGIKSDYSLKLLNSN